MPNKKHDLVSFSPEEGKKVTEAFQKLLEEYQAEFTVTPIINPNGTIGAKVELFKKIESPYIEADGETPTQTAPKEA